MNHVQADTKNPNKALSEWLNWAVKTLVTAVGTMVLFYMAQNNANLEKSFGALTATLNSVQKHMEETDRQVLEMRTSREIYMPRFIEMMASAEETRKKVDIINLKLSNIETMLDRHKLH